MLGYHFAGQSYGSVGTVLGGGEYDLGAVRTYHASALDADAGAHDDDYVIAFDDAHDGETYAGVAAGRFYDGLPGV